MFVTSINVKKIELEMNKSKLVIFLNQAHGFPEYYQDPSSSYPVFPWETVAPS